MKSGIAAAALMAVTVGCAGTIDDASAAKVIYALPQGKKGKEKAPVETGA